MADETRFGQPVMTADDCFSVQRLPNRRFFVQHFRTHGTKVCCCTTSVQAQQGESDDAALWRAAAQIEKHHGR